MAMAEIILGYLECKYILKSRRRPKTEVLTTFKHSPAKTDPAPIGLASYLYNAFIFYSWKYS